MKITPLTIDFDVTNAQEVEFVNELMNRLFGGAPLKAMAAPTESPINSTSVPTFSEPTQTAAPVQEFKKEAKPRSHSDSYCRGNNSGRYRRSEERNEKARKGSKAKDRKGSPTSDD